MSVPEVVATLDSTIGYVKTQSCFRSRRGEPDRRDGTPPGGARRQRTAQGLMKVPVSSVPSSKVNSPRAWSRPVSQRALTYE